LDFIVGLRLWGVREPLENRPRAYDRTGTVREEASATSLTP
jgi:hypothetical protein